MVFGVHRHFCALVGLAVEVLSSVHVLVEVTGPNLVLVGLVEGTFSVLGQYLVAVNGALRCFLLQIW